MRNFIILNVQIMLWERTTFHEIFFMKKVDIFKPLTSFFEVKKTYKMKKWLELFLMV